MHPIFAGATPVLARIYAIVLPGGVWQVKNALHVLAGYGAGGLVEVAVEPGGDRGGHGRAERARLALAGQVDRLLEDVRMDLQPEGRPGSAAADEDSLD